MVTCITGGFVMSLFGFFFETKVYYNQIEKLIYALEELFNNLLFGYLYNFRLYFGLKELILSCSSLQHRIFYGEF